MLDRFYQRSTDPQQVEGRSFPSEDLKPRLGDDSARNCLPPIQPVALQPRYVLRFLLRGYSPAYLVHYSDAGILFTGTLGDAKLFANREVATHIACMVGDPLVVKVLVDSDLRNPRVALEHERDFVSERGGNGKQRQTEGTQEKTFEDEGEHQNQNQTGTGASDCGGREECAGERRSTSASHGAVNKDEDSEDTTGAVNGAGKTADLLAPSQLEEGKRLFVNFIETFLQIEFVGFQSGWGLIPDQILFNGPHHSTLSIPVDTLLEPRDAALELIQNKIRKSVEAFAKRSA